MSSLSLFLGIWEHIYQWFRKKNFWTNSKELNKKVKTWLVVKFGFFIFGFYTSLQKSKAGICVIMIKLWQIIHMYVTHTVVGYVEKIILCFMWWCWWIMLILLGFGFACTDVNNCRIHSQWEKYICILDQLGHFILQIVQLWYEMVNKNAYLILFIKKYLKWQAELRQLWNESSLWAHYYVKISSIEFFVQKMNDV